MNLSGPRYEGVAGTTEDGNKSFRFCIDEAFLD